MNQFDKLEDEKYSTLYKQDYPSGQSKHVVNMFDRLDKDLTVIDIGCGRADLANSYYQYVGVDLSSYIIDENKKKFPKQKFFHSGLINLPNKIYSSYYDLCLCLDVLEHLPENSVERCLESLFAIPAGEFLLSISCRPSGILGPKGENLHLTVKDYNYWIIKVSDHAKIKSRKIDYKNKCLYIQC